MPVYSLDQMFKQQTGQLSRQILYAQLFGIFLLTAPTIFLPYTFVFIGFIGAFFVLVYTAVFAGIWYRDYVCRLFCKLNRQPIPPRLRLDQIRNTLGWLVFIDIAVVLILIGSTGGVSDSHLTGVLLLIPCIMSIVAIKPRHFIYITATLAAILFIILFIGLFSDGRTTIDPLLFFCRKLHFFCGKSSDRW